MSSLFTSFRLDHIIRYVHHLVVLHSSFYLLFYALSFYQAKRIDKSGCSFKTFKGRIIPTTTPEIYCPCWLFILFYFVSFFFLGGGGAYNVGKVFNKPNIISNITQEVSVTREVNHWMCVNENFIAFSLKHFSLFAAVYCRLF